MNREQLYYQTVTILSNAYFKKTLQPQRCDLCVVANLIVYNMGFKFQQRSPQTGYPWGWESKDGIELKTYSWFDVVYSDKDCNCKEEEYLASTGYTKNELRQIIEAFDSPYNDKYCIKDPEKGLIAVFKILKEIHKVEAQTNNSVNSIEDLLVKRYVAANPKRSLTTKLLCILLVAACLLI